LDFAHHFPATAVGIEYLRKERPERVRPTEHAPTTEATVCALIQIAGGDERGEMFAQFTDRMTAYTGVFVSHPLAGRARLATERGEVETGQVKVGAGH